MLKVGDYVLVKRDLHMNATWVTEYMDEYVNKVCIITTVEHYKNSEVIYRISPIDWNLKHLGGWSRNDSALVKLTKEQTLLEML